MKGWVQDFAQLCACLPPCSGGYQREGRDQCNRSYGRNDRRRGSRRWRPQ